MSYCSDYRISINDYIALNDIVGESNKMHFLILENQVGNSFISEVRYFCILMIVIDESLKISVKGIES